MQHYHKGLKRIMNCFIVISPDTKKIQEAVQENFPEYNHQIAGSPVIEQTDKVRPIRRGYGFGSNGGGNYGECLARIEANLGHMATKEDIQKIKVWVLSSILGGMGLAALLTVTIVKFFFS